MFCLCFLFSKNLRMFPFVPVFLYSLNLFFKFLFFPFIDWHLITQNSDSPENTSALIKKWLGQDDKYLFHIPIPCSKSFLLAQHYLFQKGFFLFYTRIFFIWKIKLPPPPRDLHAQQLQKQLNRSNTISKHLYKCTNNFILSFSYWWNSL